MIQSVQRVSDILSLFSMENPRWGITEIANALELPVTTASGLVRSMIQTGLLTQERSTKKYGLGPKIFALGIVVNDTLEINQIAGAPVQKMSDETGLICRVAIWDGDAALNTMDAKPRHADFLARRAGPRLLAYCSSLGRVLLANLTREEINEYVNGIELKGFTPNTITQRDLLIEELEKIRLQGYAVNNQELHLERASIAVPVFNSSGQVEAAISVVGNHKQVLKSDFDDLLSILRNTAEEISWRLGYRVGTAGIRTGSMP